MKKRGGSKLNRFKLKKKKPKTQSLKPLPSAHATTKTPHCPQSLQSLKTKTGKKENDTTNNKNALKTERSGKRRTSGFIDLSDERELQKLLAKKASTAKKGCASRAERASSTSDSVSSSTSTSTRPKENSHTDQTRVPSTDHGKNNNTRAISSHSPQLLSSPSDEERGAQDNSLPPPSLSPFRSPSLQPHVAKTMSDRRTSSKVALNLHDSPSINCDAGSITSKVDATVAVRNPISNIKLLDFDASFDRQAFMETHATISRILQCSSPSPSSLSASSSLSLSSSLSSLPSSYSFDPLPGAPMRYGELKKLITTITTNDQ